ncbi:MAG TPA: AtpZ/AtpI family protein [Parafilimonas sp.]|nr:AtpZ/AtpI family protein [Parafilimonas sp.]
MAKSPDNNRTSNKKLLAQYASIGTQILAGLIVSIFAGKWIDGKIHLSFPIFIWLLPLIFIIGITIKAIKDTSNKK